MTAPASTPLIRHVDDWRAILSFNAYRSLIGFGLVALLLFGSTSRLLDLTLPDLFRGASLIYLVQCVMAVGAALMRRPSLRAQVVAACAVDIAFFTCLTLSSTGVAGGLGMLLLAPVAAGGMLLPARLAALIAACAAIGMLGQEVWRSLSETSAPDEFVQAGILGMLFFITAGLAHWLARRARLSEALAAERATEVRDLAALNRRIIQQMGMGAIVVEPDGRIELINDAAQGLLELEPTVPPGQPLADIAPALATALARWREGRHSVVEPVRVGHRSLLPSFSALGEGDDAPSLIFVEDAMRQREQAQQLKLVSIGRLTANIAHEIRNPLGAISHAGQLLAESPRVDAEDVRMLDIIHRHTRRIDAIVNSVLGLSRRSQRARRNLPLAAWLDETIEIYRETSDQAPDFERIDIDPSLRVTFDPDHLRQTLFNLWDNARRYARRDDEPLTLWLIGHRNRALHACLDVIDNGPGIDAAILDEIMEPFFTTARDGTGLGLHIAAELCEANGAQLLPVAQTGGACFRIIFAQASSDAMDSPSASQIKQVS
ncbi:ATP-binding protein [Salinisphaera sp. T31B1]|uniref:two-component system sensor histidine kinase NtrB n=1 Tax=Salinisphaera sp. T31B1 TaxID=727963 RepID=UPI0033421980